MSAEDHNRDPSTHIDPAVEEHNLDSLARGLASGSISRRQAVRWMGGALLGSVLASIPGMAWAARGGNSACAKYCNTLFPEGGASHEECVSQGAHGTGPCFECGGPRNPAPSCTAPKVLNTTTCSCECPPNEACTSSGGTVNPSTCACECPAGTKLCSNGQCANCCDCSGCATCQDGTCACPPGTVLLTSNGTCAIPCGPGGSCPSGLTCLGTNEGGFCSPRGGPVASCSGSNAQCPAGSVCSGVLCEPAC